MKARTARCKALRRYERWLVNNHPYSLMPRCLLRHHGIDVRLSRLDVAAYQVFDHGNGQYILDQHGRPRRERRLLIWADWLSRSGQDGSRQTALDRIGDTKVSTVFLGLDYTLVTAGPNYSGSPFLWETMIFGGEHDQEQWRWNSHEAAVRGHEQIVAKLKAVAN